MPFMLLESGGPILLESGLGAIALDITPLAPIVITTPSPLGFGALGHSYSQTMVATGGSGVGQTWTRTAGTLPTGIAFSSAGIFSGTPTQAPYTVTLQLQVTDSSAQITSGTFSLTITGAPLTITTTSVPQGTVGVPYSFTFAASGGSGTGRVWSVIAGALPAGLSLSAAGVLSGTPSISTLGTNVTIQVNDSLGVPASKTFSFVINPAAGLPGQVTGLQMLFQGMSSPGQGVNRSSPTPAPTAPNTQAIGWTQAVQGTYPITNNNIYRSTNGGAYTLVATIAAGTSWTDTTATNCLGSTATPHNAQGQNWPANGYLYQVSAVDSHGQEGSRSATQIFVIYKNGQRLGTLSDVNNSMISTYNDTTGIAGNPFGSTHDLLNVTQGSNGQWLPMAGNNASNRNIWCGVGSPAQVFQYLYLSIRPAATGQTFNCWIEYRTDVDGDPGSQPGISNVGNVAALYGPATQVNVWGTYRLPLSLLMKAGSTDPNVVAGSVQGMFYKFGINDNNGGNGAHWFVDNMYLSAT